MPIFLQITNIPGESTATGYKGQFLVSSISWGGSNGVVQGSHAGATTTFTSVSVTKIATISSPALMLLMASPKAFEAVITVAVNSNGRLLPREIYTLSNA